MRRVPGPEAPFCCWSGDVARAADAHFFPPSKRARADPADAALARELAAADHRPDEAADAALAAALAENGTEEAGDAARSERRGTKGER